MFAMDIHSKAFNQLSPNWPLKSIDPCVKTCKANISRPPLWSMRSHIWHSGRKTGEICRLHSMHKAGPSWEIVISARGRTRGAGETKRAALARLCCISPPINASEWLLMRFKTKVHQTIVTISVNNRCV